VSDRPWSSTAPASEFQPYVPAEHKLAEFSFAGAVVLAECYGLLFGARWTGVRGIAGRG